MINLLSAFVMLFASVSDFFNKKVAVGSLTFKVWNLIVLAVAVVVFIILVIALAVESKKNKKNKENDKNDVAKNDDVNEESTLSVAEEAAADADNVSDKEENVEEAPAVINAQNESVLDNEANVEEQVEETMEAREEAPVEEKAEEPIEEAPVEEKAEDVAEPVEEAQVEDAPVEEKVEEPAPEKVEEPTPEKVEEVPVEEAPAEEPAPEEVKEEPVEEPVVPTPQEEVAEEVEEHQGVLGKYTIQLSMQGYCFTLSANNGQILYESFGYTTVEGAAIGIDTFKKTVATGKFNVSGDKYGRYRFILNKRYQGPNYPSKLACEKAIKSVEKFANNSKIVIVDPTEEDLQAYNEVVQASKKSKVVDWEALSKEYADLPRLGTFEISLSDDGLYQFCLIANNGQILYTSVPYATQATVKKAIENFRKAACLGTFFVEMDKYKRYRFILRVSNMVTYVGESYTTKASALNSIESVKNFVKTARIVFVKDDEDGPENPVEE